jgi:hypothetical protein
MLPRPGGRLRADEAEEMPTAHLIERYRAQLGVDVVVGCAGALVAHDRVDVKQLKLGFGGFGRCNRCRDRSPGRSSPATNLKTLSRFCRHNRLTAQCPICSKETALEAPRKPTHASSRSRRTAPAPAVTRMSRGPFAAVGPDESGYEIRLERVPGGLRLAAWRGGEIARRAPVLAASDVPQLLADAATKELLAVPWVAERSGMPDGDYGASPGRSGELRDELRVERLDDHRVRIARWILRPNAGWELQQAPVMLPPARFAEALAAAAQKGVLMSDTGA